VSLALVIRQIAHGSPDYWQSVELRRTVLRRPLGREFSVDELAAEDQSQHLACYQGEQLVGCLVLRPLGGGDVQMRQVAVRPDRQRQGIGQALVAHGEALARQLGFRRIMLHARDTAVPFYQKLGYARRGDVFQELAIPHWEMEKHLPP